MKLYTTFILPNVVSFNYKWINPVFPSSFVSSKRMERDRNESRINAIPYIRPWSRSVKSISVISYAWRINVFLAIYRQPRLNVRKSRNRKYESNFKIVHPRNVIVKLAYFRCASIHRARNSRDIFEDGLIY